MVNLLLEKGAELDSKDILRVEHRYRMLPTVDMRQW